MVSRQGSEVVEEGGCLFATSTITNERANLAKNQNVCVVHCNALPMTHLY